MLIRAGQAKPGRGYRPRLSAVATRRGEGADDREIGTSNEIKTFCEVTYGVDFPMTEKVSVFGSDPHSFYQWAKTELGARSKPRWNFHKYVVERDGKLIDWFSSTTSPKTARG